MAAIQLTITIPDNPALQGKIVEAVKFLNMTEEQELPEMTGLEVRDWLEDFARDHLKATLRAAYNNYNSWQAENIDF